MANKSTVFRFKVDADMLKKAKRQAKSESRTTASLFRFVMAAYLKRCELANGDGAR